MKLVLSSDQSKFLEPNAKLITLSSSDRMKISAQKFGLFFALAVASVFIPVLHFVLVPVFLILAVVLGIKSYSTLYRLHFEAPALCVQCQQPFKNELLLNESLRLKCDGCASHYLIETSGVR